MSKKGWVAELVNTKTFKVTYMGPYRTQMDMERSIPSGPAWAVTRRLKVRIPDDFPGTDGMQNWTKADDR